MIRPAKVHGRQQVEKRVTLSIPGNSLPVGTELDLLECGCWTIVFVPGDSLNHLKRGLQFRMCQTLYAD